MKHPLNDLTNLLHRPVETAGRFGHLNNEQAATLLSHLDNSSLQHIVAAHLSQQNNLPSLAVTALSGVLGCTEDWVAVADQQQGLDWREVA
ncbi:MAG: hypothetical protein WCZ98_08095 [Sideroxydans sp.]